MESLIKMKELKQKIKELHILAEDFINFHHSKKNKIVKLENEIESIKSKINQNLDDLEKVLNQK